MTPAQRRIIQFVADRYRLTFDEITGRSRKVRFAHPRQEAMWELRQDGRWSYPQIARLFHRDHTTAIHACRQVEKRRADNMARDLATWERLGSRRDIHRTGVDNPQGFGLVHSPADASEKTCSANAGTLSA